MNALSDLARYTYSMLRPPEAQTVSEWADKTECLYQRAVRSLVRGGQTAHHTSARSWIRLHSQEYGRLS